MDAVKLKGDQYQKVLKARKYTGCSYSHHFEEISPYILEGMVKYCFDKHWLAVELWIFGVPQMSDCCEPKHYLTPEWTKDQICHHKSLLI